MKILILLHKNDIDKFDNFDKNIKHNSLYKQLSNDSNFVEVLEKLSKAGNAKQYIEGFFLDTKENEYLKFEYDDYNGGYFQTRSYHQWCKETSIKILNNLFGIDIDFDKNKLIQYKYISDIEREEIRIKIVNKIEKLFGNNHNTFDSFIDKNCKNFSCNLNSQLVEWVPDDEQIRDLIEDYGGDYYDYASDHSYWEATYQSQKELHLKLQKIFPKNCYQLEFYEKEGIMLYIDIKKLLELNII